MKIILINTPTSTIVIPVLTLDNVKLETELTEIDDDQINITSSFTKMYSNSDGVVSITSGLTEKDGAIQPIIISHNCEGADNELSITKIIDYLKSNYSNSVSVDDLDFGNSKLSVKIIKIK